MIDEILTSAGFIKDKTYTETVFRNPPAVTFCVYSDEVETDGSDFDCELETHTIDIELYALNKPDKAAEKRIKKALKKLGIHYTKFERIWLQSEKYYQTVYEYTYTEKEQEDE